MLFITTFFACDDRFAELNKPTKGAVDVPGETLFTNGIVNMFYLIVNSNVNENVFRMYAQYWAQTTYPDESQYNMVNREIPDGFWVNAYRDALVDLQKAREITEDTWRSLGLTEAERDNRLAIIDVTKVYIFAALVDTFGAAPFSESLSLAILSPKYDTGEDVYTGIIAMLDEAIDSITPGADSFAPNQDPVYEGNTAGWLKFANSLKLRLAITISDYDATTAGTMVTEAIAGGLITSNNDNTSITYLNAFPNTNPVWLDLVQSGRADYVVANTIVDKLLALSDPRLPVFAEPLDDGVTYEGGIYGDNNTFSATSHIGAIFHEPNLEGLIMDYSEVEFMLAEAKERGFTVSGTAESHYNAGITASLEYWGISNANITTYLANPAVAYTTATGTWKQKIGTQQWIAYFNRGFEAWNLWKRLDFTGFNAPPGMSLSDIPVRLIFPIEEATLNPSNLDEAIELIGGTDDAATKVFWDLN